MKYFSFNENKHAPEQFGSDADLKGYEIESVLLGGRLCKPTFGLEHLMFIQVIGESKHPITKKTKTHAIEFSLTEAGWENDLIHGRYVLIKTREYAAGYLPTWLCRLLIWKGCIKFLFKKDKHKTI